MITSMYVCMYVGGGGGGLMDKWALDPGFLSSRHTTGR